MLFRILTAALAASAFATSSATAATLAPAEFHNFPIASHGSVLAEVRGGAPVRVRDAQGVPLVGSDGTELRSGGKRAGCPTRCVRIQGFEPVVTGSGQTLYYVWPGYDRYSGEQGFVAAGDLAPVSFAPQFPGGNGAPATPLPDTPAYLVTPSAIDRSQGYVGVFDGQAHTFAPYGFGSAFGDDYTLLTWNWVDRRGGGIARAAVSRGDAFRPAAVAPITTPTFLVLYDEALGVYSLPPDQAGNPALIPNGSVTVRYGSVSSGAQQLFGWIVTSHTDSAGQCIDHLAAPGGGGRIAGLCP